MAVDMRVVRPQDVMKMLLEQPKIAYWKKWTDTSPNGTHPGYAQKEDHRVMDR